MKNFYREDQLLALCGLNCGLCQLRLGGYCPGCGGGEGNQSCKLARCSLEHGGVAYCYQCEEYPCEKYEHIDDFDSFITHMHRKADMKRAEQIGLDRYHAEQQEKIRILQFLLEHFNDGRRKTVFCLGVNLLDLEAVQQIAAELATNSELGTFSPKERSVYAVKLFQCAAEQAGIELKLRKKKS